MVNAKEKGNLIPKLLTEKSEESILSKQIIVKILHESMLSKYNTFFP